MCLYAQLGNKLRSNLQHLIVRALWWFVTILLTFVIVVIVVVVVIVVIVVVVIVVTDVSCTCTIHVAVPDAIHTCMYEPS